MARRRSDGDQYVELRSDTFSMPTPEMLRATATARLGNDGYREDPTVRELERYCAEQFGKDDACLFPSGTMANLAAMLTLAPRGTRIIVGRDSDIYRYEGGGASLFGALIYETVDSDRLGRYTEKQLEMAAAWADDPQLAKPSLLCLENPCNRLGGIVLSPEYVDEIAEWAHSRGLRVHLDGARIFNACAAAGVPPRRWASSVDSLQFCLSKGLCAPVGSVLVASRRVIKKARDFRTILGGTMRQAGIIAAAGLVALKTMPSHLPSDHARAWQFAKSAAAVEGVEVDLASVQTNVVRFRIAGGPAQHARFLRMGRELGVRFGELKPDYLRVVMYHGVTDADAERAAHVLRDVMQRMSTKSDRHGPRS
jgi:threonine aldolase